MLLSRAMAVGLLLAAPLAWGQRHTTREALERMEETISVRVEESNFNPKDLLPLVVVSVAPAFEESKGWYPTAALASLTKIFGTHGVRSCEACMAPRTFVESGRLEESSGAIGLDEIVRLDEQRRGSAAAARTAAWLDEHEDGVSLRLVDLRNSRVVLAENFDPNLTERASTQRTWTRAKELDRRAKGNSITQLFFDAGIYPNQRFSFDWADQWGDTNSNLSGVTISILDPLLGIGGAYYRVFPDAWNLMVGAQIVLSLPIALIQAISQSDQDLLGDHLITGVLVVRVPIWKSNYGLVATVSTNGRVTLGLSLMNISFLPVLL